MWFISLSIFDFRISILFKTKRSAAQQQQQQKKSKKKKPPKIGTISEKTIGFFFLSLSEYFANNFLNGLVYLYTNAKRISNHLPERSVWHASVRRCPSICLAFGFKIQNTRYKIQYTRYTTRIPTQTLTQSWLQRASLQNNNTYICIRKPHWVEYDNLACIWKTSWNQFAMLNCFAFN